MDGLLLIKNNGISLLHFSIHVKVILELRVENDGILCNIYITFSLVIDTP